MLRLTVVATAISAALAGPAEADPVTWTFYETGFTFCNAACAAPAGPALASLALPSATSTGSAFYDGSSDPVLTGDRFILYFPGTSLYLDSDLGNLTGPGSVLGTIEYYDISWSEAADQLDAIRIDYLTWGDEAHLGLSGGWIASDYMIGGCVFTQCGVTGYWRADPPAPAQAAEPVSGGLLLTALLLLGGRTVSSRRNRNRETASLRTKARASG